MSTFGKASFFPVMVSIAIFSGCDNTPFDYMMSPGQVVTAYISFLRAGEIEHAMPYVTGETFNNLADLKAVYDSASKADKDRINSQLRAGLPAIHCVTVVSESTSDNESRVTLKVTTSGKMIYARLRNQNGVWKIYSFN